jgi:hypothetical protein
LSFQRSLVRFRHDRTEESGLKAVGVPKTETET